MVLERTAHSLTNSCPIKFKLCIVVDIIRNRFMRIILAVFKGDNGCVTSLYRSLKVGLFSDALEVRSIIIIIIITLIYHYTP